MMQWHKLKDPGGRTVGYYAEGEDARMYWAEKRYSLCSWTWMFGNDFDHWTTDTLRDAKRRCQAIENAADCACDNFDWCPYCDECGDMGCPSCEEGPNHDHESFRKGLTNQFG